MKECCKTNNDDFESYLKKPKQNQYFKYLISFAILIIVIILLTQ